MDHPISITVGTELDNQCHSEDWNTQLVSHCPRIAGLFLKSVCNCMCFSAWVCASMRWGWGDGGNGKKSSDDDLVI